MQLERRSPTSTSGTSSQPRRCNNLRRWSACAATPLSTSPRRCESEGAFVFDVPLCLVLFVIASPRFFSSNSFLKIFAPGTSLANRAGFLLFFVSLELVLLLCFVHACNCALPEAVVAICGSEARSLACVGACDRSVTLFRIVANNRPDGVSSLVPGVISRWWCINFRREHRFQALPEYKSAHS